MFSWISKLLPPKYRSASTPAASNSNQIPIIIKYDQSLQKFNGSEIFGEVLSNEIVIYIASYLDLQSLYNFGKVNQFMIKLLFFIDETKLNNLTLNKEALTRTPYYQLESQEDIIIKPEFIKVYKIEEDNSFALTQNLIWKNLVFLYFPNFVKELNIKNWMHVMRRRVVHLKHENRSIPRVGKPPSKVPIIYTQPTYHFIENCANIYQCQLAPKDICFRCNKKEGGKLIKSASNQCEFAEHVKNSQCVYMKNVEPQWRYDSQISH